MQLTSVLRSILAVIVAAGLSAALTAGGAGARSGQAAAGTTAKGDPGAFMSRIVGLVVEDDYAHAWNYLHPAHKRVASRREYVTCELLSPMGWVLTSVEVLGVSDRRLSIPGRSGRTPAKVVTLRIGYEDPALSEDGAFVQSFRAIPTGSRWAWTLTPERYALYRADACGG